MVNILTGMLVHEKVRLLPPKKERSVIKVMDIKFVEHKGHKRKLLLVEDGTIYKVKRSKLENTCRIRTICLRTVCLYYTVIFYIFLRNKLIQTLICVLIFANLNSKKLATSLSKASSMYAWAMSAV